MKQTTARWRDNAWKILAVALVGSLAIWSGAEAAGSELTASAPTVVLSGAPISQSGLAAADFNGDGDKELVAGGQDGMLYVIGYSGGSWSVVWARQTAQDLSAAGAPSGGCVTDRSDIRSSPAVGDLDGDGHLEIVVSTGGDPAQHRNGGVLVYRYDRTWSFSVMSNWPQPRIDEVGQGGGSSNPDGCWDGIWSTPALGDLDGDGDLEVVVEGFDRRIHAWHHNGVPVAGWPIYRGNGDAILRGGWSSPALGDIDDDGLPEVVVGSDSPPWGGEGTTPDYTKGTVWAINGDSSNVPGWPVVTDQLVQSSPALGDIDGDGMLEIVVGTGVAIAGAGHKVYAWEGNGAPVAGWPRPTGGYMQASPALGDLDGDGDLEVVIGCGSNGDPYPAPCSELYAWRGDGSYAFSPVVPDSVYSWISPNGLPYAPVLADYDGDGGVEILVVHRWSTGISTVDANGTPNNDAVLVSENELSSSPIVDELDGDGQLEIAIGGANAGGTNGAVYVWNVAGSASAPLPWPMFHHNVRRTGNPRFDATPPTNPMVSSPTHAVGEWSGDNTIRVNWSGAGDEETGIARYYYSWDLSPTKALSRGYSWVDGDTGTLTSPGLFDGLWYFHIRAMNGAGLLAEETAHYGPIKIDTTPPSSSAGAPACAVQSVGVSWGGKDYGSGIATYDVQVRAGISGSWTPWRTRTTALSGVYSAATGQTYYFRSLARDQVGNVESPPADGDAYTWLTRYGFSGSVHNGRGEPVFAAQVTSSLAGAPPATTDYRGDYLLCHEASGVDQVWASRDDFGPQPSMDGLSGATTGVDFYLRPANDAIVNGQFETGNLSGWSASSSGSASVGAVETAHTGSFAAELDGDGPGSWSAELSQTVLVPQAAGSAVLSLLYQFSGDAGLAEISVQGPGGSSVQTLPTAADWSHAWIDVSAFKGQTVTVHIAIQGGTGDGGTLTVDEVSVGKALVGVRNRYLPAVRRSY
jgi:hypothetical protein